MQISIGTPQWMRKISEKCKINFCRRLYSVIHALIRMAQMNIFSIFVGESEEIEEETK